jgi:hypothetical protein
MRMKIMVGALAVAALLSGAGPARAGYIPYATPGVENPVLYTFTAAANGDVVAYFQDGQGAAFTNVLGMRVNGVDTGIYGLNNHTTAYGTSLNFGAVSAGDTLVFVMRNLIPGYGDVFSDRSLNGPYDAPGPARNHVYSTPFTTDGIIPTGTLVAFEDIPGGGDYNYRDLAFVFTNVATGPAPDIGSVPEPASVTLLGLGTLAIAGFVHRKRQRKGTAAV